MTEHDREHEHEQDHGQGQQGRGQGIASSFGSGKQAHGGYGQGSYGYGQGGAGGQQVPGQTAPGRQGDSGTVQRCATPRDFQRSDARLREMICERLIEEHGMDASDVAISVQGGRVTLEGSIDGRMAKYQVEDLVNHMGVSDVQNNLRVSRDSLAPGQGDKHGSSPSSQSGSSGGVSSLGMSGSGTAGVDRTATGGASTGDSNLASSSK